MRCGAEGAHSLNMPTARKLSAAEALRFFYEILGHLYSFIKTAVLENMLMLFKVASFIPQVLEVYLPAFR